MSRKTNKSTDENLDSDTIEMVEAIFGNGSVDENADTSDDLFGSDDEDEDSSEEDEFSDSGSDGEEDDRGDDDSDEDLDDAATLKKLLEAAQNEAEKYKALAGKNEKRAKASYKQLQAQKLKNKVDTKPDADEGNDNDIDSRIEAAVMRALESVSRETNKISARAEFNTQIVAALSASSFSKDQKEAFVKAISVDVAVNDDGTLDQEKLDQLLSIIPAPQKREKKNINLGQGRSAVSTDNEDPYAWLR